MDERLRVNVEISDDEYTAYISIIPEPGVPLLLNEFGPLLKSHGVVFGFKKETMISIVNKYKNGEGVDHVIIAEGIRRVPGVKPEIEYKFDTSFSPREIEPGKTDYREISKYRTVKKGQLLVVKKRFKKPIDGIKVTGDRDLTPQFEDIPVLTGAHIVKEEDNDYIRYSSELDGVLIFRNNELSVYPELKIAGNVDFNVGNIDFDGNVKIGRDVLPDFTIKSGGNISVMGSALACMLHAALSIEVKEGIVGKNKGEIHSGENLTAGYIENSIVHAESDINVRTGIIGSQVTCGGKLIMETLKSRVVGSTVQSVKGIVVHNAGSPFDNATTLITGILPEKEKAYLKIKNSLNEKIKEAKCLERKYGRAVLEKKFSPFVLPMQTRGDCSLWHFLKGEIQTLYDEMKQLESDMYDNNAEVEVREKLYARVRVRIGRGKLVTAHEFFNIKIKYCAEEDKLKIYRNI
ncbi:MAG: DUF342 domain-containing protein [Candidatus Omnitrophota bacterium]